MKPTNLQTLQVWHRGQLHCTVVLVPSATSNEADLYFEWNTDVESVFRQLVGRHGRCLTCNSHSSAMDQLKGLKQFAREFNMPHLLLCDSMANRTGKRQISPEERQVCHPSKSWAIGIIKGMLEGEKQDLSKLGPV